MLCFDGLGLLASRVGNNKYLLTVCVGVLFLEDRDVDQVVWGDVFVQPFDRRAEDLIPFNTFVVEDLKIARCAPTCSADVPGGLVVPLSDIFSRVCQA